MKLNNTPIKPLLLLHKTRRLYTIAAALILWTLLTTGLTVLAINSKFFTNTYQCEVTEFEPPEHEKVKTSQNRLVDRIVSIYKIPKAVAYEVVGVAAQYTRHDWPDHKTVLAIIATESAFKKDAVSSANAKGYMQVLKASGKPVTIETYQNIQSGTSLLRDYYQELGSKRAAIESYNIGVSAYKQGRRAPEYYNKVQRNMQLLSSSEKT